MTAFTPGPWEVTSDKRYVRSDGRCVAKLDWEIRDETDNANALLIATAPELYEALDRAIRQYDAFKGGPIYGALEAARAVLAKARPRTDPIPSTGGE